jgi:hypothetical protein
MGSMFMMSGWTINPPLTHQSCLGQTTNFGGHTAWSKVVNLTTTAIYDNPINGTCSLLCGDPTIAVNGTDVYVAWVQQHAIGGETIMFDSSTNNGKTWTGPVDMLPTDPNTPHEQEMAAWGKDVYITWDDHSTFFTVSHNNGTSIYAGNTTANMQNLTALETPNPNGGDRSREPHVAAWGGNVYVTWEDNRQIGRYQILMAVSTNAGNNFVLKPSFSTGLASTSWLPVVIVSGTYVYDTWYQNTSPKQVYMAASVNNGSTFTSPIKVSNDAGNAGKAPLVAAQGQDVFMFWKDTTYGSGGAAVGSLSTNAGASFPSTPNVFSGGSNDYIVQQNDSPQTAIVGHFIFICWTDTGPTKPTSVYYSTGTFS